MAEGDNYLFMALDLLSRAEKEADPQKRTGLEALVESWSEHNAIAIPMVPPVAPRDRVQSIALLNWDDANCTSTVVSAVNCTWFDDADTVQLIARTQSLVRSHCDINRGGYRREKGVADRGRAGSRCARGKISVSSPLARSLIGKTKGVTVEEITPGGVRAYQVQKVEWG